jgi:hypothetical protein
MTLCQLARTMIEKLNAYYDTGTFDDRRYLHDLEGYLRAASYKATTVVIDNHYICGNKSNKPYDIIANDIREIINNKIELILDKKAKPLSGGLVIESGFTASDKSFDNYYRMKKEFLALLERQIAARRTIPVPLQAKPIAPVATIIPISSHKIQVVNSVPAAVIPIIKQITISEEKAAADIRAARVEEGRALGAEAEALSLLADEWAKTAKLEGVIKALKEELAESARSNAKLRSLLKEALMRIPTEK